LHHLSSWWGTLTKKFVRIYVNCVKNANVFEKKNTKNCLLPSVENRPSPVAAILRNHSVSLIESYQKTYKVAIHIFLLDIQH